MPDLLSGNHLRKVKLDKITTELSDPWPSRHAKRRLTSREFLARYDQILVQDGKVEFKTDNKELFEFPWKKWRKLDGIWKLLPLICIIMKRWYREML